MSSTDYCLSKWSLRKEDTLPWFLSDPGLTASKQLLVNYDLTGLSLVFTLYE